MSTKRILGITAFSVLLVAAIAGFMLFDFVFGRDSYAIPLPHEPAAATVPQPPAQYEIGRIEITRENAQAVISTLSRLQNYSRNVRVTTFWEAGYADFYFYVTVYGEAASIISTSRAAPQRHVIIANDRQYIWHAGDTLPFVGYVDALGGAERSADEWQMLVTFEDVLEINPYDIIDAGHIIFDDTGCIFITYRTPLLGLLRTYYISIRDGLVIAAFEYDESGFLTYEMRAGSVEYPDSDAFLLPDGTNAPGDNAYE